MDSVKTDQDIVIGILVSQRNNLMNQIVELELQLYKLKEQPSDNVSQ